MFEWVSVWVRNLDGKENAKYVWEIFLEIFESNNNKNPGKIFNSKFWQFSSQKKQKKIQTLSI